MRTLIQPIFLALALLWAPLASTAQEMMIDTFENRPETRWTFFADTVMGGVSNGDVAFLSDEDAVFARMTGSVSTQNNGGFIQIRTELPTAPPEGVTGIRLIVRGNDQPYFVHLRTSGTILPWQYYQARFDVTRDWTEVKLPFNAFKASGRLLKAVPGAGRIKSVGIVAFGRDHQAEIDVREVGFY